MQRVHAWQACQCCFPKQRAQVILDLVHYDVCGQMSVPSITRSMYYEFESFCKEAGIKRELIFPYNPQQNGVVEQKNGSIIGTAKAMTHDHVLPDEFTYISVTEISANKLT
jgi:hypothetical protein